MFVQPGGPVLKRIPRGSRQPEMIEARTRYVKSRPVVGVELVEVHNPLSVFDDDPSKRIFVVCSEDNLRTKDIAVERRAPRDIGHRETEVVQPRRRRSFDSFSHAHA